jgi:hypothetical protein
MLARLQERRFQDWSLALLPALILAALLLRSVWDVDIFWQLKLGEMILAHHGPIAREPFAASHLGETLPAVAWLGQAIMAGVRLLGGWNALRVFDALCWLGGFCAVAAACRRKGAAPAGVLAALSLAMLAAFTTASVRPQSFAALCFGLLLALLRLELAPWLTVCLAAPLLVLWQNLHPSESVGMVALGVSAVAGWFAWWRDRTKPWPIAETVLVPVSIIALFLTPDGFAILSISARNAETSLAINVREWLPVIVSSDWISGMPILYAAAIVFGIALWRPARVKLTELAVAAVLFAMTVVTIRFVLFWAVALIPLVARTLTAEVDDRRYVPRWAGPLAILVVALVMPVIRPTHFDETLPMAAISRLRQENVRGVIYSDFPFGGPLIDAGYPQWRVAYDGRYYRYTADEWHFNGGVEAGELGLRDILRKWHVAGFLLKVSHNGPLARELSRAPGWRPIWKRDGIVVYVPRSGGNRGA